MKRKITKFTLSILGAATAIYFSFFYELGLVATYPGGADPTAPLVHVAQPADRTAGHFYMTSVGEFRRTPPIIYLHLKYFKHADFTKESDVYSKKDTEEVEQTQGEYDMRGSQQNAIAAAYVAAKIPYKTIDRRVRVRYIMKGSDAEGKLKLNDRIIQFNSTPIATYSDYEKFMATQTDGDVVQAKVLRGKKQATYSIQLWNFAKKTEKPRMGIGLDIVDEAKVEPIAKNYRVKFAEEDAIGPSGGLMFALEIYNQLIPGDITKGRKIAGTGEIDAAGHVGPIGGVKYKVMGAKEKGAKIFLAPEWNAKEARKTAAKIGGIHVVSVKTIDDAIRYLTTTGN